MKISHWKVSALLSPPLSLISTMCPQRLIRRGLAATSPGSAAIAVRAVLLVRAMYTFFVTGLISMSSGRSILVAPSLSAAPRALTSTVAWSGKPLAAVSGPWPHTSGSQLPLPSASNLAT